MNGKKLTDDELDQVSGGKTENVATECFYCGCIHVLKCDTGLKIIPYGLKKFGDKVSQYYCTATRKAFYMVQLENGGTAILNEDMKIIK